MGNNRNKKDRNDCFINFEDTILFMCAGLVERVTEYGSHPDMEDPPFRFVHSSVHEYLSVGAGESCQSYTVSASTRRIATPRKEALISIATSCLQWLTFRLPAGPLS